jgi:hypothetical protein
VGEVEAILCRVEPEVLAVADESSTVRRGGDGGHWDDAALAAAVKWWKCRLTEP